MSGSIYTKRPRLCIRKPILAAVYLRECSCLLLKRDRGSRWHRVACGQHIVAASSRIDEIGEGSRNGGRRDVERAGD